MQLTYDEIVDILDMKYIAGSTNGYTLAGSTNGYTLPHGIYEITDNNLMLEILLPNEVKVNITIDDIRLRSNLNTNKK